MQTRVEPRARGVDTFLCYMRTISKGGRASKRNVHVNVAECPVCMEPTVGERCSVRPFACTHVICNNCDGELFVRADDRCPTCRAPRTEASKLQQCRERTALRARALVERAESVPAPQTVFFEIQQAEGELPFVQALLMGPSRTSGTVASDDSAAGPASPSISLSESPLLQNDPDLLNAVNALAFAHAVPMAEFFNAVLALRHPRRGVRRR